MLKVFIISAILSLSLFSQNVLEFKSEKMTVVVEKIASNLGIVWGMSELDEHRIILSLKKGQFVVLNTQNGTPTPLKPSLDVFLQGQAGLLDVQASPSFEKDKTIFFTYVKNINNQGATTLAKAQLINEKLENIQDILVTKSLSDTTRHFGSRITFDDKGHIYFGIGDRGVRPNGQDLSTHSGSIIRLNLDGSIPQDNPFINQKNALPEIYSFGHRNPQGLFFYKKTQQLISGEHGPRGGDEINIIKKGTNYGWPVISYGKEYWNPLPVGEDTHKQGMAQPIKYYDPSIAPGSLIVYEGSHFKSWRGDIFQGALKLTHLNRIVIDKNNNVVKEERLLQELDERIRSVMEGKNGKLYISTDSGNIYRLFLKEK
ncbi:MAG: dehydrogenase [Arcobacter sp.]|uniref:PQQ-dependent sugar dehydrogenase n=1 Tax=uncultured Arcobacter sp. TaxID=165434 RepID=UPI000CAE15AD|nr:PQQ-dependent sugar dehydrogenase [uncultured Arcobacter sp.]PLY10326.1 MAG: dehydrogenase [Arcobacter sp.]